MHPPYSVPPLLSVLVAGMYLFALFSFVAVWRAPRRDAWSLIDSRLDRVRMPQRLRYVDWPSHRPGANSAEINTGTKIASPARSVGDTFDDVLARWKKYIMEGKVCVHEFPVFAENRIRR